MGWGELTVTPAFSVVFGNSAVSIEKSKIELGQTKAPINALDLSFYVDLEL